MLFDVCIKGLCVPCQQSGPLWLQIHLFLTHSHKHTCMTLDVAKQGLFHENLNLKIYPFQMKDSFILCDASHLKGIVQIF